MSVRRTLAATLAAGVLLAGCSDDPEPTFEPPASPSPSESESSSAEPEAQSPEEFIREWVMLDNAMTVSGETEEFRAASKGCDACESYADQVEGIYEEGGFIRTRGRTVVDVRPAQGRNAYELEIESAPTKYREMEGGPLRKLEGGAATFRLVLGKRNDQWVVIDEVQL
jgi:hypothetical protein